MNIAIVGAGINGITTALELARDGHRVTIYEQTQTTAEVTSFAPGGWVHPCSALSLASPGVGMPLAQLQKHPFLLQAPGLPRILSTWRWMRQWKKREKTAAKQAEHGIANALQAMDSYSQQLRSESSAAHEDVAERTLGSLVMLRTPQEAAFWAEQLPQLHAHGVHAQLLDASQTSAIEPGIGQSIAWLHALYFPNGESLNPRLWTQHLRQQALDLGVQIQAGMQVQAISTHPLGVRTTNRAHPHEAVVLCTGGNDELLAATACRLPRVHTWGYSITSPVRDPLHAPRASIMDWAEQTTISRMGQRIRVTAGLELSSTSQAAHHTPSLHRMYRLLNDWFPGGAQLSSPQVQVWRGQRTLLPDGLPAVGESGSPGIWLNLAHGSHGIALASGCARALADLISQRPPALDMQPFNPLRF